MRSNFSTRRAISVSMVIGLMGLNGCATVSTKEVVIDSSRQLAENFTPAQLVPAVRSLVDRGQAHPDRFKSMRITYRIESEEEGRKQESASLVSLTNMGNGYVQTRAELTKNGVPYRINLGLTYGGIYKLRTQTIFVGRSNALAIMDTKELKQFDMRLANPVKGDAYTIVSTTGPISQLMNFQSEGFSCLVGDSQAASAVHSSLTGEAIAMDCKLLGNNNAVTVRHRYVWLTQYGVALQQEAADARVKSTYVVQDASVVR